MGLGDLVTHLVANTAGFQQGFSAAQGIAKSGVAGITSALAPLTGAIAAAFGAGTALEAAREDLRAMQKLEAVLKATGGAAGMTAKEIGAYASELQRATNFGDEVTVGAASILATFRNIRGDNFKDALRLMQDMSTVMGTDLNSAAIQVGKALNDPIKGITALTRVGVSFTEQQKQQIKAMAEVGNIAGAQKMILAELEGEFGGAAAAIADPWTQLTNTIGDIGEQIGSFLLPHVNNLSSALSGVMNQGIETFSSLQSANQDLADTISVVYSTLGDQAYLWYLKTELAVVQTSAAFGHFFSNELPVWLSWLGDNWQDVMFTIADYTLTAFANIGSNIREAWQALVDFINGEEVKPNFKGLTEGAVSAIKAMPDIPERVKSEFEKSLIDDIAAQEDFLNRAQQDAAKKILEERAAKEQAKSFVPQEQEFSAGTASSQKDLRFGAAQKGSAEQLSAVFSAMRSTFGATSPEQKQVKELEGVNDNLEEIASILRERGGETTLIAGSLA